MPGYLQKAFTRFKHEMPVKIQNPPHPHVIPQYGAKTQYPKEDNESPPLSKEETKIHPSGCRDSSILCKSGQCHHPPVTQIDCNRTSKTNTRNNENSENLLDYCATQEGAIITYNASKMILAVHSDTG
jgi:hypothetical protein